MKLILIRGIPGSGKSTLANAIKSACGGEVCEADQYFTSHDGKYEFDHSRIKEAHSYCRSKAEHFLIRGSDVIVSNTFIRKWEMNAYFDMAKRYNAQVIVLVARGQWENTHNVPIDVINRMIKDFEE